MPKRARQNITYRLSGTTPVSCKWNEVEIGKAVSATRVGVSLVSTSFLGIDHNFTGRGKPILFETMVFGGPADGNARRYRTWVEAVAGHDDMVELLKSGKLDAKAWVSGEEV